MTICLQTVDTVVDITALEQFSNVQRGIIFLWLVFAFFLFIITGVRLVAGSIDAEGQKYEGGEQNKDKHNQSQQQFDHTVIQNQRVLQDDPGSVKFGKVISKFETLILPLAISFVLNLNLGVTYPFCFVLFFLAFIPMVLFNVLNLHKRMCSHKVFRVMAENLWIILSFFWLLNIWTTGRYIQPYHMSYTDADTC